MLEKNNFMENKKQNQLQETKEFPLYYEDGEKGKILYKKTINGGEKIQTIKEVLEEIGNEFFYYDYCLGNCYIYKHIYEKKNLGNKEFRKYFYFALDGNFKLPNSEDKIKISLSRAFSEYKIEEFALDFETKIDEQIDGLLYLYSTNLPFIFYCDEFGFRNPSKNIKWFINEVCGSIYDKYFPSESEFEK